MKNRNKRRLVDCSTHGEIEGYLICRCVLNGAKVRYVEHPGVSHETLGSILCEACTHHSGKGLSNVIDSGTLVLICGFCAKDKGFNRVAPEFRVQ